MLHTILAQDVEYKHTGVAKKYGIYYVTCLKFFRCKIFASSHRPLDRTIPAISMANCRGPKIEPMIIVTPGRETVSLDMGSLDLRAI